MMKMPKPSAATMTRYDAIASALAPSGAAASAMFGMPTLKVEGKGFAGVFGDALVFKLAGASHASALALAGAVLFDPSGMGRPMKEWVVVPASHAARWAALAEEAFAYVAAGAEKKAPAAKKAAPAKKAPAKAPAGVKKTSEKKASSKKAPARKAERGAKTSEK